MDDLALKKGIFENTAMNLSKKDPLSQISQKMTVIIQIRPSQNW